MSGRVQTVLGPVDPAVLGWVLPTSRSSPRSSARSGLQATEDRRCRAIAARSATVEFDFLGMSFTPLERHGEGRLVGLLCDLLAAGNVEQVLLSQDVCHDSQLRRYGGNGYTYIADAFPPRLREAGVSDDEIRTITIDNPRRLLTIS